MPDATTMLDMKTETDLNRFLGEVSLQAPWELTELFSKHSAKSCSR